MSCNGTNLFIKELNRQDENASNISTYLGVQEPKKKLHKPYNKPKQGT